MNANSQAFAVSIVAPTTTNKPGDATPPLTQIVDPFQQATWTLAGGVVKRNGVVIPSRFRDNSTTRIYVNTTQVWTTSPHGYSYWNGTALVWDGNHGPDGGYF